MALFREYKRGGAGGCLRSLVYIWVPINFAVTNPSTLLVKSSNFVLSSFNYAAEFFGFRAEFVENPAEFIENPAASVVR